MDLDNHLIIKLNMLIFYIIRILFYFFSYYYKYCIDNKKFKILDIIILNEIYQLNNMIIAINF